MYLYGSVEPVQGFVYTGSSNCIIIQSIAKRFNSLTEPNQVNMYIYIYGNVQCVTSCGETEAELRIENVVERVKIVPSTSDC